MATPQGSSPTIEVEIVNTKNKLGGNVIRFDWKAMINGGFIVKCTLVDPNFSKLNVILDDPEALYLREARKKPTPIRFRIGWNNGLVTPWRNAIISDLNAKGDYANGEFSFVAVDPISYYLNWGDASGRMLVGKIGGDSGVIKQVLDLYVPNKIKGVAGSISVIKEVDDTDDNPTNWWMMRQDPKTFISSLLEWSCPFTKNKTSWIVSNGEKDDEILIKIQETYERDLQKVSPGISISDTEPDTGDLIFNLDTDVRGWKLQCDHLLSTYNSKLVTSGMSAISGEYFDQVSDPKEENVFVTDANTENKLVPNIKVTQGFTKPEDEFRGWSYVHSIPEFSNAEPKMWYKDYISGRARQQYMDMLNMVMRIKVKVKGEPRLYASEDLGQSRVILNWLNADTRKPRMMHGKWLLYGWHHKYRSNIGMWDTDVYLSRLDYDAAGKPGARS